MSGVQPIEIIGGGLAGLSLGLALRRTGVPVTILEAGDYPRHRVCGEFITGLSPATIARLGLAPSLADALQHREVAWFLPDSSPRIQQLPAPALGVSRHALDARLAAAFVAAGGDLRTNTRATDLANRAGRVFATGRRRGRSPWLGLKVHVRGLELTRDLEVHLGDQAYVGLSRVEDDTINVCGLFRRRPAQPKSHSSGETLAADASTSRANDPRESRPDDAPRTHAARGRQPNGVAESALHARGPQARDGGTATVLFEYLRAAKLDALATRLASGEIEPDSFCAVAALVFDRGVTRRDRIELGDACAMIPPFTGNGMAMAFQSAELALDPLLGFACGEFSWAEACRATHAALRGRFRLRLASALALHPFLLQPRRQRWLAALNRTHLLPFAPLYAALH